MAGLTASWAQGNALEAEEAPAQDGGLFGFNR